MVDSWVAMMAEQTVHYLVGRKADWKADWKAGLKVD